MLACDSCLDCIAFNPTKSIALESIKLRQIYAPCFGDRWAKAVSREHAEQVERRCFYLAASESQVP